MAGGEGGRGNEADVGREGDEGEEAEKGGSEASLSRAEDVDEGDKEGLIRVRGAVTMRRIVAHEAGYIERSLGRDRGSPAMHKGTTVLYKRCDGGKGSDKKKNKKKTGVWSRGKERS
jgi:hypothetical protein